MREYIETVVHAEVKGLLSLFQVSQCRFMRSNNSTFTEISDRSHNHFPLHLR